MQDDLLNSDGHHQMALYECGNCHRTLWSEFPPECCGVRMERKPR